MIKSAILEEQKAQLKKEELAARILNQSRNELYLKRAIWIWLWAIWPWPRARRRQPEPMAERCTISRMGCCHSMSSRGGRPAPGSICMEFFIACSAIPLIGKGGMRD